MAVIRERLLLPGRCSRDTFPYSPRYVQRKPLAETPVGADKAPTKACSVEAKSRKGRPGGAERKLSDPGANSHHCPGVRRLLLIDTMTQSKILVDGPNRRMEKREREPTNWKREQ